MSAPGVCVGSGGFERVFLLRVVVSGGAGPAPRGSIWHGFGGLAQLGRVWGLRSGPQWRAGSGAGAGRGPPPCEGPQVPPLSVGTPLPRPDPPAPSTSAGLSELPGVFYPSFLSEAHPSASIHTTGSPVSARLSFGVLWYISSLSDFSSPHTLFPENPAPIQTPWVMLNVAGAPLVHRCPSSQDPAGVRGAEMGVGWPWRSGDSRFPRSRARVGEKGNI